VVILLYITEKIKLNIAMSDDTQLDSTVNSILTQLKDTTTLSKKVEQIPENDLNKENLENFVIKYASRLIVDATESVEYIKDNVQMAPTAEDVVSLAELIKSTSSALEVLNKIVVNNKKSATSLSIKKMDVESKREELDIKVNNNLIASREEMMNQLFKKAKVVEGTIVDIN
jgi:hypothetical protein